MMNFTTLFDSHTVVDPDLARSADIDEHKFRNPVGVLTTHDRIVGSVNIKYPEIGVTKK